MPEREERKAKKSRIIKHPKGSDLKLRQEAAKRRKQRKAYPDQVIKLESFNVRKGKQTCRKNVINSAQANKGDVIRCYPTKDAHLPEGKWETEEGIRGDKQEKGKRGRKAGERGIKLKGEGGKGKQGRGRGKNGRERKRKVHKIREI